MHSEQLELLLQLQIGIMSLSSSVSLVEEEFNSSRVVELVVVLGFLPQALPLVSAVIGFHSLITKFDL